MFRKQCCGSGSVGSICFWPRGSGSFYRQAKIVRKTLIPTVLRPLYDFLSVKNDVNVPSKSKKQKNLETFFCWRLEGHWRKYQDLDPDPLFRGMDPRIRIRTKISWISNTVRKIPFSWKTDKESVTHYGDIRPAARQAFWANIDFQGMGKEEHCSWKQLQPEKKETHVRKKIVQ